MSAFNVFLYTIEKCVHSWNCSIVCTMFCSNKIAVNTAAELAVDLGYLPYVLSTRLDGEARQTGQLFTK